VIDFNSPIAGQDSRSPSRSSTAQAHQGRAAAAGDGAGAPSVGPARSATGSGSATAARVAAVLVNRRGPRTALPRPPRAAAVRSPQARGPSLEHARDAASILFEILDHERPAGRRRQPDGAPQRVADDDLAAREEHADRTGRVPRRALHRPSTPYGARSSGPSTRTPGSKPESAAPPARAPGRSARCGEQRADRGGGALTARAEHVRIRAVHRDGAAERSGDPASPRNGRGGRG